MLKSCASIGCTKRQDSRVNFHIFPVGKVRQKQWLASLKLVNPTVLKHAVHYVYSPQPALLYRTNLRPGRGASLTT